MTKIFFNITRFILFYYLIVYMLWKSNLFLTYSPLFSNLRSVGLVMIIQLSIVLFFYYERIKNDSLNKVLLLMLFYAFSKILFHGNTNINEIIYSLSFPITYFVLSNLTYNISYRVNFLMYIFKGLSISLILLFLISYFVNPLYIKYTEQIDRGVRYTFGFFKPSYFAEAIIVLLFTITALKKYSKRIDYKNIMTFSLLLLLYISGSRAGLLSVIIFFLSKYLLERKLFLYPFAFLFIIIFGYAYNLTFNFEEVNKVSSGRLLIWTLEIEHNITSIQNFIFGQSNPEVVFEYTTDRYNDIYHLDSFFVELFIKNGLIGVLIFVLFLTVLYNTSNNISKAIILSTSFYGLFEGPILSMLSLYGLFTMLLILIINSKKRKRCLLSY